MNIRAMIAHLNAVATDLPDGLDSDVRVHICNGHDEPSVSTRVADVLPERTMDASMTRVLSSRAVVTVHPHSDDTKRTVTPATMGVDDELARMVAGDIAPAPTGSGGAPSVIYGGIRIPLTGEGKPITPGSPEAVEMGCICDPTKNNDGAGADSDGDSIRFIFREACPVHRIGPNGGDVTVLG